MSMKFKYIRIQGKEMAENTKTGKGIFSMCAKLRQNNVMDEEDAALCREIEDWFSEKLPWPPQCKRQENVVCWFKADNAEEMMKYITPMMWLLDRYKHPFYVVYTNYPGEIVYEDEYQIVVKAGEDLIFEPVPPSWSPED